MRLKRILVVLLMLVSVGFLTTHREIKAEPLAKEEEFRGVWVSPLVTDYLGYLSETQFKSELNTIFDNMEYFNMNSIVFHVRIMNDAFYPSIYSNYSRYHQGVKTFDPLAWAIEEAHNRGIEFHAWLNPYRIQNAGASSEAERKALAAKHPALNAASDYRNILGTDSQAILNPGSPAVREFLLNVCEELVTNYDVDAIHFDDYFYIAGIGQDAATALDRAEYELYNPNNLSLENWRREQVDIFIQDLRSLLNNYNLYNGKAIQLGISPSGIYRNGNGQITYDAYGNAITNGSDTRGFSHYDYYLYADTLKWANEGWIDYLIPQSYWSFTQTNVEFPKVMGWWDAALKYKKCKVYSGMGLYMTSYSWANKQQEAHDQVAYVYNLANVGGHCIFAYQNLQAARNNGDLSLVKQNYWDKVTLPIKMDTLNQIYPNDINELNVELIEGGVRLSFAPAIHARRYAIYRSTGPLTYSSDELIAVVGKRTFDDLIYYWDLVDNGVTYNYGVRSLSQSNTPSSGVQKSTAGANMGEPLALDPITKIDVKGNVYQNEKIEIEVLKVPTLGGVPLEYQVLVSTDGNTYYDPVTTGNNRYDLPQTVVQEFTIPSRNDFYVKVLASSNIATTQSEPFLIDVKENLGSMTIRTLEQDLYYGEVITFEWNHIPGISNYKLQTSTNNVDFEDVGDEYPVEIGPHKCRQKFLVPNYVNLLYVRVLGIEGDGEAKSNVLQLTFRENLGKIEGVLINNSDDYYNIVVNEGDQITVSWDVTGYGGDYVIRYSYDGVNFAKTIRDYDRYASAITIVGDRASQTFSANWEYKVYIIIEEAIGNASVKSDIYWIHTVPSMHLFIEDLMKYMFNENKIAVESAYN